MVFLLFLLSLRGVSDFQRMWEMDFRLALSGGGHGAVDEYSEEGVSECG